MSNQQRPNGTASGGGSDRDQRSPSTEQLRAVAQRRHDAEEKLEQHVHEAERKAAGEEDGTTAGDPAGDNPA